MVREDVHVDEAPVAVIGAGLGAVAAGERVWHRHTPDYAKAMERVDWVDYSATPTPGGGVGLVHRAGV